MRGLYAAEGEAEAWDEASDVASSLRDNAIAAYPAYIITTLSPFGLVNLTVLKFAPGYPPNSMSEPPRSLFRLWVTVISSCLKTLRNLND